MSQVIKAFLGIFLILCLGLTGIGIVSALLTAEQAQNLQSSITAELENSHFYPPVLQECFSEAESRGYSLQVTLYREDGNTDLVTSSGTVPSDVSDVILGQVELSYPLRIPVLDISSTGVLSGFAR